MIKLNSIFILFILFSRLKKIERCSHFLKKINPLKKRYTESRMFAAGKADTNRNHWLDKHSQHH